MYKIKDEYISKVIKYNNITESIFKLMINKKYYS